MPLASDIASLLDSGSTALTLNSNLFVNGLPDTTGRAVCVTDTVGLPAYEKFAGEKPAMTRPRAQVLARSTESVGGSGMPNPTNASVLIQDCWDLVVGVANETVNSVVYQRIEPLQDPYKLRIDEKGRTQFVFNVQATRTPTTQA